MSVAASNLLMVDPSGVVTPANWESFREQRRGRIASRLDVMQTQPAIKGWLEEFEAACLFDGERYIGNASGQDAALEALGKARSASSTTEVVDAMEDFVIHFCGFHETKVKGLINAVHFFFSVDVQRVLAFPSQMPDDFSPSAKELFDCAQVAGGEMLLRTVVENAKGQLVVNPFSPGFPMSFLNKLPMYAQMMMVLGSAVDASAYQDQMPELPLSINVYAGLLSEGAPVLSMVDGVQVVEVMEMTRGAQRSPALTSWVSELQSQGIRVMLDDFNTQHPALDSSPAGIKVCMFQNAAHTLQVFKEGSLPESFTEAGSDDVSSLVGFYGSFIRKSMPNVSFLVMEGSENCMKSDLQPGQKGPPVNFSEPRATVATALVYKAAATILEVSNKPGFRMIQQGGRALYDGEVFDDTVKAMVEACGKPMDAARREAGTMAWMGSLAPIHAARKIRSHVCGVGSSVAEEA